MKTWKISEKFASPIKSSQPFSKRNIFPNTISNYFSRDLSPFKKRLNNSFLSLIQSKLKPHNNVTEAYILNFCHSNINQKKIPNLNLKYIKSPKVQINSINAFMKKSCLSKNKYQINT